jgi:hypothetical protein
MSPGLRVASRWSIGLVVLVAVVVVLVMMRRPAGPAIDVSGSTLTIENLTDQEWRNVTVTVNAYYRGGTSSLAPHGRLDVSLRTLMTGLGQYFNPARETVRTVQVRATDASGRAVVLDWPDKKVP